MAPHAAERRRQTHPNDFGRRGPVGEQLAGAEKDIARCLSRALRGSWRATLDPVLDRLNASLISPDGITSATPNTNEVFRIGVEHLRDAAKSLTLVFLSYLKDLQLLGRRVSLDHVLTGARSPVGSIASNSTEMSPKPLDRLSLALVGRVGNRHSLICQGVTAIRSK